MPAIKNRKPVPDHIRAEVIRRAHYRCEDCGVYGSQAALGLHHLRYRHPRTGQSIFGRETARDLAALCWPCHQARHLDRNGTFWPDPEEMAEYWHRHRTLHM